MSYVPLVDPGNGQFYGYRGAMAGFDSAAVGYCHHFRLDLQPKAAVRWSGEDFVPENFKGELNALIAGKG